jgi:signal transduction histidine kinase
VTALVYAVDDDPVALRQLEAILAEESDWELHTFGSAPALRAAALERPPDAVIADRRLGGGSGLALLAELAAIDGHLVAILCTQGGDPGAADAALEVGPLRHLEKPLAAADALAKLHAGLERRTLSREVERLRAELQHREQALRASRRQVERTAAELASASTELETATERLVESEKLAAVGRVASGIAHEIGNQLALVGYAEALKSRVAGDPVLTELADLIVSAQRRLAAMVDEIRDFAGGEGERIEREPADLAAVVDEALGLLAYDRDVRARNLERRYRDKPLVALNRDKFCQVVINLVTNAVAATRAGDTLSLELALDDSGSFADLRVSDPGTGMPPEILERLGEPFFTTRPGSGSGLGVGICMRIVEEHGGSLTYCSDPGAGTIARVRLPVLGEGAR